MPTLVNYIHHKNYLCNKTIAVVATISQNIYLTKREKLHCQKCKKVIPKGKAFVAEKEDYNGLCLSCSPFASYTLLPPGNVALTRRSKKHSKLCGVLLFWNQRRRRYERKGQYVEAKAIVQAEKECSSYEVIRANNNVKAAEKRLVQDKVYIQEFGKAIRAYYPNCPAKREFEIATHSCEKYSGRVGRTAAAKQFDTNMIDLAVEAHIRHTETNYDARFGKGMRKRLIRADLKGSIERIMLSWK
jgi:hypothetical protein